MMRRLVTLGLLPALASGQAELGLGAAAVGMAGEVASVLADKVTQKLENSELPQPCQGPSCCLSSTCLKLPGLGCSSSRGLTQCVGSSLLPMHRGMCACMSGACNDKGLCVDTGAAAATVPVPAPAGPAPDYDNVFSQAPAPAVPVAEPQLPGLAQAPAPAPQPDDFSRWHTGPERLFSEGGDSRRIPMEDFTIPIALYGVAWLGCLALAPVLVHRARRRWSAGAFRMAYAVAPPEEERLVAAEA